MISCSCLTASEAHDEEQDEDTSCTTNDGCHQDACIQGQPLCHVDRPLCSLKRVNDFVLRRIMFCPLESVNDFMLRRAIVNDDLMNDRTMLCALTTQCSVGLCSAQSTTS